MLYPTVLYYSMFHLHSSEALRGSERGAVGSKTAAAEMRGAVSQAQQQHTLVYSSILYYCCSTLYHIIVSYSIV